MKFGLIILMVFSSQVCLIGQDFITTIYFEDSVGRKDSLIIGDIDSGTQYDMENIIDQPLDSFDIRLVKYTAGDPSSPVVVHGDCGHIPGSISYDNDFYFNRIELESKEYYGEGNQCDVPNIFGVNVEFLIPTNSSFPIYIHWDNVPFQDTCRANSYISEMPFDFVWQDSLWCEERVNYPEISLKDSSSVVLEEPNFLTFRRSDSTIMSVYYLFLASTTFDGQIIYNNVNDVAKLEIQAVPNPNNGSFTLAGIDNFESLEIYDIQGNLIKSYSDFTTDIEIDQTGLFILKIDLGDGRFVSKKVTCY